MPERILPPEYADNLRSVNLHLQGVVHGELFRARRGGGTYVDFAPEVAYRGVKQLIGGLSSGDVVSIEGVDYSPEHVQELVDKNEQARQGTFRAGQHPDMLAYRRYSTPMEYAENLALYKGIPIQIADASKEEMTRIKRDIPRGVIASVLSFVARRDIGPHRAERDWIILEKLARIAGGMATNATTNRKPTLAHVVGGAHVTTLGRLLEASGVPYTHNLRPVDALVMRIDAWRRLGYREIAKRRLNNSPEQRPYGGSY